MARCAAVASGTADNSGAYRFVPDALRVLDGFPFARRALSSRVRLGMTTGLDGVAGGADAIHDGFFPEDFFTIP